ncbi:WXG100 family type VII secretion target [Streptomyces polygonati]|uniref:WXG100 family type VII secretion target n=1 Tax=Streptomyces polygonati TaxID=1617087 RepID=A0ABV8HNN7_9ACTN
MSDLQVTDEVLSDAERLLGRLYGEFRTISARRDELHDVWGSGAVADAMDAFVDNWSRYRKKLLTRIDSVGELVGSARETFRQTDQRLARAS